MTVDTKAKARLRRRMAISPENLTEFTRAWRKYHEAYDAARNAVTIPGLNMDEDLIIELLEAQAALDSIASVIAEKEGINH